MSDLHQTSVAQRSLTDDDLLAAYPWPDGERWVRAMMLTTLDGAAAGPDGLSGSLGSEADMRVFNTARRLADAVLVGAQTLRAERYTPMVAKERDAALRSAAGQLDAPVVAVVSGSLDLPWDLPIWQESAQRPLVITDRDAPSARRTTAEQYADLAVLDATTPEAILDALTQRGLQRIVCEGGPRLLLDLTAAGLVDELDITVAPLMAGTGETPHTSVLATPHRFDLAHALMSEGFLMNRYVKAPA
ncbi:dihydrofolate reductase family protein [Nocardioides montaniterrae]